MMREIYHFMTLHPGEVMHNSYDRVCVCMCEKSGSRINAQGALLLSLRARRRRMGLAHTHKQTCAKFTLFHLNSSSTLATSSTLTLETTHTNAARNVSDLHQWLDSVHEKFSLFTIIMRIETYTAKIFLDFK